MGSEIITIRAPRHRYFSVRGLLLTLQAEIINQNELELATFTSEPLHFSCNCSDRTELEKGLQELRTEFGEDFSILGADS